MQHRVRRALVSVYDKDGVVEFCRALQEMDIEIVSSGGTARLLGEQGIRVTGVADYTGFPEMLGGRVKTLHPRIHAGILAVRDNASHMKDLAQAEILPIDLVAVNLYPFEKTAAVAGIGLTDVVEMIDIGGPTMVRAAAKNFAHVGIVVEPSDYDSIVVELHEHGGLSDSSRLRLSAKAFRHTSNYDLAVHAYLSRQTDDCDTTDASCAYPETMRIELVKSQSLRYGENPHQTAAFYRDPLSGASFAGRSRQLQGKPLSFNNILDLDAALALAAEFPTPACAIIKHGNPCGAARGSEPLTAFSRALECDPTSAFGGVIAFNRPVDERAAAKIAEQFYEGVIAPGFDEEAQAQLRKKKNLRLIEVGDLNQLQRPGYDLRRVGGGYLVQDWDRLAENVRDSRVVTRRAPSEAEWQALEFAWIVAKHVKSNAIVFADATRTVGIGAGQMSRVDSSRLAIEKAQSPIAGTVVASDAFFPFRDGVDTAGKAGATAVIQPGGSIRDDEVIAAADEREMAMVFTGRRHFRH